MGDCGDEMGGGLNGVMDGVWEMEDEEWNWWCEIKRLVREWEKRLGVEGEGNDWEVMKGEEEIKCVIEKSGKEEEIGRVNGVVDGERDEKIIKWVVEGLGNKSG